MTKQTVQRLWIGAAVAVAGSGIVGRELVRSGTVGVGLLEHWWGQAIAAVAVVAVAGFFLNRAYRR